MDKKTEKVLDSILSVLIAIVGEILINRNKEENKKDRPQCLAMLSVSMMMVIGPLLLCIMSMWAPNSPV